MSIPQGHYRPAAKELQKKVAEISRLGALSGEAALLAAASCAAADGHQDALRLVLRQAATLNVRRPRLEEALLQTYLFAGYPRAINALTELRAAFPARSSSSIPDDQAHPSLEAWAREGQALCRRVYGDDFPKLVSFMEDISPPLGEWMVTEGYGKVLSRPGLSPVERELCAVAALVPLHVPPQLKAHFRGSLRVGATPPQVDQVLEITALLAPSQTRDAAALWDRVKAARP